MSCSDDDAALLATETIDEYNKSLEGGADDLIEEEAATIGVKKFISAKDVTDISSPLPLLKKGHYQAEPEAMWKKRRLKQNLALNKLSKEELEL